MSIKVTALLDSVLRAGGTARADRDPSQDASRDGGSEFGDALRARLREARHKDVPAPRAQTCTAGTGLSGRGVPFNQDAALLSGGLGVVGVLGVEATLDGAAALAAPAVAASSEPSLLHTEPSSVPPNASMTTIMSATSSASGAAVGAEVLAPAAHSVPGSAAFSQAAGTPVASTTQESGGDTPAELVDEQGAAHPASRAAATHAGLAPGASGLSAAASSASAQSASAARVPAEAPTDPQLIAGLALARAQTTAAAADQLALTRVLSGDTGSASGRGVGVPSPADASVSDPAIFGPVPGPFSGSAGTLATAQAQPAQLGAGSAPSSAQAIGPHGAMVPGSTPGSAPGPVHGPSDAQNHPHGAAGTPSSATLAGAGTSAVLTSVATAPDASAAAWGTGTGTGTAAATATGSDATPAPRADAPSAGPAHPGQTAQPATPTAHVAPAAAGHVPTPVPAQVVAAIAPVMMRRDGSYHVDLQLDPASLGRVRVHVSISAGEVVVQMAAAESSARDMLRQNMDQLRQQLSDAGLDPTSLDVDDGSAWQDPRGQEQAREAALARQHREGLDGDDTPRTFPVSAGDPDRTVPAAHEADGPLDLHL